MIANKIGTNEKKVAEYFLQQWHFTESEKKLFRSVAFSSHYVNDEEIDFKRLVELHKFLLN